MKLFKNFVFRNVIGLIIFAATIFCPLYFGLPRMTSTTNKILLGVAVLLLAAIEGILYILLNYKMLISPIATLNTTAKRLSNGEYNLQTDMKYADQAIKKLEKSTNGIANAFKNLEQMRKSFVANASHELRSPLTSMQGFLQAILDGTIAPDEREKYLKIVLNETKRLNSLITSMLDLSRMESGKNPISLVKFDINAVVKQVIERFEPNLIKKEQQLDVDFDKETCYVFADKDKIVQVLINLIDNAIKYSPAYSRILVSTHIRANKLYVTVKDQGVGINKKDQILIWDKFFMADKARTPNKSKGTGLGLSIVKKIIEDHKESVWVESNKGMGATFIFTLTIFDPTKHKLGTGKSHKNSV